MQAFSDRGWLCAVVAARTSKGAAQQLLEALRHTASVEVRFDWFAGAGEVRRFMNFLETRHFGSPVQLIATCRRRNAGGKFPGSAIDQLRLLRSAIRAGCGWVDVEIETVEAVPSLVLEMYIKSARGIISFHDFGGLPRPKQLRRIVNELSRICSDSPFQLFKIAARCESLRDSGRLLKIARNRSNAIIVPMGDVTSAARILCLRMGSRIAYAPIEKSTAPGQVSLREFRELYRGGDIGSGTRVYGIIGNPVAHSFSPLLFNAALQFRKINAVYVPFLVSDLRDFVEAISLLGIRGFSVTLPFKEKILRFLDSYDALAESIGAVNTVGVRADGRLIGYNTDSAGILFALKNKQQIPGSRILILGAGGAARAAAFTLAREGASVSICSRRAAKAAGLARAVHGEMLHRAALEQLSFDVIINATPVGMHPHEGSSPVKSSELNCSLAFDMVYRPRETEFLQLASRRGIKTVSGLEMFLAQAIAQWKIWMSADAPREIMRRAVMRAVRAEEMGNRGHD